jgi:hypothetical protein
MTKKNYLKLLIRHFDNSLSCMSQREFRDIRYTDILSNYEKNQRRMHWLRFIFKCVFFAIVCIAFVAIIGVSCYTIYKISNSIGSLQLTDLGVVLTALGSIISAIIVLPSTIAKHLFPENGETAESNLVSTMQEFDNKSGDTVLSSKISNVSVRSNKAIKTDE